MPVKSKMPIISLQQLCSYHIHCRLK